MAASWRIPTLDSCQLLLDHVVLGHETATVESCAVVSRISCPGAWLRTCVCLALVCSSLLGSRAARAEPDSDNSALSVDVHGFVSQGLIKTTDNNYLAASKRGSLEFSEVGLNFTKSVTEELRVGVQLFARDLGPVGNYRPQFDWYYLDYHFWDWLGIRAGRTKLPFGLYNEIQDVDQAREPILLPQSMYPIDNRDLLLAQTGGEAYGQIKLGDAGALEYRAYGGTIYAPIPTSPNPSISVTSIEVPYLYGGRLMWQTPLDGLQLGGSAQKLRLNVEYALDANLTTALKAAGIVPSDFTKLRTGLPFTLWVASAEYAAHDLLLAFEYGRWSADVESSAPLLYPEVDARNERYYAMASYRVTPWFTPGLYYSVLYPDVHNHRGRQHYQHDFAATVRYDLNANWLVKLEGHVMHGTAALNKDLNDGHELPTLVKDWGLLLFKTTAYF